jgi:hypothetical protein
MAITGTPSSENPYIVVPENFPAFKDEDAAKRYIKKNWAAVPAAQRERYVLAKVVEFVDPDYDIKIIETPIK